MSHETPSDASTVSFADKTEADKVGAAVSDAPSPEVQVPVPAAVEGIIVNAADLKPATTRLDVRVRAIFIMV